MLLVVGATGLVGGEVCRQLVAAGTPVRALVRPTADPAKVAWLRLQGIELVEGDVRDPVSLTAACRGVDAVVCTISSMPFAYVPGVNDIATVDTAGLRNLIDAAQEAGVGQFVYTSFSGHLDLDFPLAVAKRTVEGWVRASGLEWTILRPGYFMEVWLTPAVGFDPLNASATIYGTGEAPISWISTRDVASFAIASLSHPAARNAVLELGGPRPVTPLEAVKVFEAVIGRPIALTFVPTEALEARQAADTDPMGQSFAGLMRCYAKGDPIEMGRTMTILPHAMVSVPEYAATIRQGVASH